MKAYLGKVWHGFRAAVTSPEAVRQEKSLVVLVVVRVLLAVGASAGLVDLISQHTH